MKGSSFWRFSNGHVRNTSQVTVIGMEEVLHTRMFLWTEPALYLIVSNLECGTLLSAPRKRMRSSSLPEDRNVQYGGPEHGEQHGVAGQPNEDLHEERWNAANVADNEVPEKS